jgi:hypothetical protein
VSSLNSVSNLQLALSEPIQYKKRQRHHENPTRWDAPSTFLNDGSDHLLGACTLILFIYIGGYSFALEDVECLVIRGRCGSRNKHKHKGVVFIFILCFVVVVVVVLFFFFFFGAMEQ